MLRMTGLAIVGVGLALASLGSERWISAGYDTADAHPASDSPPSMSSNGGDEAYWLNSARPKTILPTATIMDEPVGLRGFEVGTRLTISGSQRLNLDIISSAPLPNEAGLLDQYRRPLILVTAKERKGTRIVRFLVEADQPSALGEKTL